MGQQQLLLIVLGVIIVGIAIVVGLNMFQTKSVEANKMAVIADLTNLAAKAQMYYKKPSSLGGGSQDFNGFALVTNEQSNDNGSYRISTAAQATKVAAVASIPAYAAIAASATTIYVTGYGTEKGDDGTNLIHVYLTVTGSSFTTTILN
ncbi:hypothetical protein ISS30_02970 [bacterium]|nr:hypothetical protein [bacterium]